MCFYIVVVLVLCKSDWYLFLKKSSPREATRLTLIHPSADKFRRHCFWAHCFVQWKRLPMFLFWNLPEFCIIVWKCTCHRLAFVSECPVSSTHNKWIIKHNLNSWFSRVSSILSSGGSFCEITSETDAPSTVQIVYLVNKGSERLWNFIVRCKACQDRLHKCCLVIKLELCVKRSSKL